MLTLPPNLPPQIQDVLPMMAQLSLEQRASIAGFLLAKHDQNQSPSVSRLGARALGVVAVSDDFDDELIIGR